MKTSEIRDELLGEHAGLRGHLDAARLAAERWSRGDLERADVHARLAELAEALRTHHQREERALTALLRSTERFVDDEHVDEHDDLLDALARVSLAQNPREGGNRLERFCDGMLAHMTWEERAFLNRTVLRDDEEG